MKRAGITSWTVEAGCKGSDLELLRFNHPFMGFDVPLSSAITLPWMRVPVLCILRRATVLTTM